MTKQHDTLIDELIKLLEGGSAHVSLKVAVKGLPAEMRGIVTNKLPYTIWQIVEHIRIAQLDMLEFSKDGSHESPKWPDDYWPASAEPPSKEAWHTSVKALEEDLEAFEKLVKDPHSNLYAQIPWGEKDQTLLREVLLAADHNSYHTGELVFLRRLLGAWTS